MEEVCVGGTKLPEGGAVPAPSFGYLISFPWAMPSHTSVGLSKQGSRSDIWNPSALHVSNPCAGHVIYDCKRGYEKSMSASGCPSLNAIPIKEGTAIDPLQEFHQKACSTAQCGAVKHSGH